MTVTETLKLAVNIHTDFVNTFNDPVETSLIEGAISNFGPRNKRDHIVKSHRSLASMLTVKTIALESELQSLNQL
jgi:hypothetical protein